jgi:hypothetical protein
MSFVSARTTQQLNREQADMTTLNDAETRAWFDLRCADAEYAAELAAQHAGKTLEDLDEMYEALHGYMA